MVSPNDGQGSINRFGDKSPLITALRLLGKVIPGDRSRTFLYRALIYKPRIALRRSLNSFYRVDHVYEVIGEFTRTYKGSFSILEFGVADGYAFSKNVFATHYLHVQDRVSCYGFDSFKGMPASDDLRDQSSDNGGNWSEGQYRGRYEILSEHLQQRYGNWRLYKGWFEDTLTPEVLEELRVHRPILVWIDCDYYTSARTVMERLIPYLPSGCVVYFDEYEFNFGSRFTGEARLVREINSGEFGDGIELVLDRELSWDLRRCYRFVSEQPGNRFERLQPLRPAHELRLHGNDSALP